jgi:SAM-dependent methyltransferase
MFSELESINRRPSPFESMTIADLWTDPHVSGQMLRYHLDGSVSISSHKTDFIDAGVFWLAETFHLDGRSRVLDLGCGPGLWSCRLARTGAQVTGVDFSARSIAYAREAAAREGLAANFVQADYLSGQPDGRFDLVLLIMRDLGALAPDQRAVLLGRIASALEPRGAFVFDLDSMAALATRSESVSYSSSPAGGFWSAEPYFEFRNSFVYPEQAVSLDRHVIVEAARTRTIYNWVQYFSPESLEADLEQAGLSIDHLLGDVSGRAFDPDSPEFAVVTRRR